MSPVSRFAILGLILAAGWFLLWPDLETGVPISSRRDLTFIDYEIGNVSFSPDSCQILIGTRQIVYLHDAEDGTLLKRLWAVGYRSDWRAPTFSPDGRHFVTASFRSFSKATFSADGRGIVTIGGFYTVTIGRSFTPYISLWDADGGQVLRITGGQSATMPGRSSFFTDAQFSPDGRRVVTTSNDRKVQLWDVSTGGELITLPGAPVSASHPAFSPDGHRLAASFFNDTVKVWQLLDGAPYHDSDAATLVRREVPDIVQWLTGRYRLARRKLGLAL